MAQQKSRKPQKRQKPLESEVQTTGCPKKWFRKTRSSGRIPGHSNLSAPCPSLLVRLGFSDRWLLLLVILSSSLQW